MGDRAGRALFTCTVEMRIVRQRSQKPHTAVFDAPTRLKFGREYADPPPLQNHLPDRFSIIGGQEQRGTRLATQIDWSRWSRSKRAGRGRQKRNRPVPDPRRR